MVAVDHDREAARPAPNLGEELLTLAAVYGPNAAGKSNVVGALAWLRDAVADSVRLWEDDIPVEPFAFATGSSGSSEFVIETTVDDVRFEYIVELDRRSVLYEGLFHYPQKKRRRIFEREGSELKLQRGLGGLSGIRKLLTARTLALSVARRFDEPLVTTFVSDILRIQMLGSEIKVWSALIGPVLTALQSGSIVVLDQVSARLHPTLSAELLRVFRSRTINPYGAQLIFTSHDTSLLNHLNRDEVWLTEKRPDGSTRLSALAEFAGERVRTSQNLESAYLHGRFGALPQVDRTEFRRALERR
ncbi:ATP-binding protein [Solwaraspora sp. WMMD406]|uniref:AAA family ATPase n=1 Tax=Solwaraspora sp. WMMD406 TaxID=3016095 RepID=UPI002417A42D|nr:ATP-binding protein [Solwaraspora sp. WMMD406]MDG4763456.1 ATP-binding protein [Solwaraspora sp. WMMD406]